MILHDANLCTNADRTRSGTKPAEAKKKNINGKKGYGKGMIPAAALAG